MNLNLLIVAGSVLQAFDAEKQRCLHDINVHK